MWIQRTGGWGRASPIILVKRGKLVVTQLCPTVCNPMDFKHSRLLCTWDSPGKNTGVDSHSLFRGIFPTQWSNSGLLHCRQILYWLSYEGNPASLNVVHLNTGTDGFRRRQWHPTPVLLPGKSHGQRSLVGCSPWGREESDMTERLYFHFSLSCIGEGNGNPLQCSCLENPRDGGAWWADVFGAAQSRTRLTRHSSSSSSSSNWWFCLYKLCCTLFIWLL